jgi:hypothetical protein
VDLKKTVIRKDIVRDEDRKFRITYNEKLRVLEIT